METNKYRESLLAEQARLQTELSTVGRRSPQNPQDWDAVSADRDDTRADENDNADALEDFANADAVVKQLESQEVEVAAALARIEAGTFGTCEVCQGEIEGDRLDANPAARTCKAHLNG